MRVGHAGEFRWIVRPARDDDDASRRGELLEQTRHQCEVTEMVDAESHFDTVNGELGAVDDLQASVAHDGV